LVEGRPGYVEHFPHSSCPEFDPDFQWRTLPGDATDHNVRSHAHTRAFNRAVSNLVGFGEVSAEEVERDETSGQSGHAATSTKASGTRKASTAAKADSGTSATEPAATAVSADGSTKVVDFKVSSKAASGDDKGWVKYAVKFEDGREASTFDKPLQTEAARLKSSGEPCRPIIEKTDGKGGKVYTNLKGFEQIAAVVPAEPPPPPDEPVSGPEKVLTVRKVSTDKGDRWVIQTDKRQLVTDVEQYVTESIQARKDNRGIVPVFDAIPTPGGHTANKLKSLSVVDLVPVDPSAAAGATA
jgi:hypothetical protein